MSRRHPYRPEVVDQQIEYTQYHHQQDRAPLCLKPHHNHHTRHQPKQTDQYPRKPPVPTPYETHKQQDQQNPASKLDILFSVFLCGQGQACRSELLADPAVAENHEETAHYAEVAEEEVEVENEAIPKSLSYDDAD